MKETAFQTADKLFQKWTVFPVRDPVSHRTLGHIAVGKTVGSGNYCRGIAIRSSTQPFDAKEGEAKAVGRMVKSIFRSSCEPIVRTPEVKTYRDIFRMGTRFPLHVASPRKGVKAVRGFTLARFLSRVYPFRYKAYYGTKLLPMERKALGV